MKRWPRLELKFRAGRHSFVFSCISALTLYFGLFPDRAYQRDPRFRDEAIRAK